MMGNVIMSGIVPQLVAPSVGILASDLAIGSSVYLMENGAAVEYLVVHQGIPSDSSLYDDSCNGLWLLRKDIYNSQAFNDGYNHYAKSDIHSYLNSTFLGLFDAGTQSAIKQAKIPYHNNRGSSGSVSSGANGLDAQVFLLSGYEVGWTRSDSSAFPIDGACLGYFKGTAETDSKRIAYSAGVALSWWLRSPNIGHSYNAWQVTEDGAWDSMRCTSAGYGIRPALILPSTALFDEETLILKGVA